MGLVLTLSSLWSTAAWAGDTALAEALFRQAKDLMDKGQFAAACQKFEDSQVQDPAVGTQLNLAVCYEKAGRTASAWATYEAAAAAARDAKQADREAFAREHAKALESQLHYLTLEVTAPAEGLQVHLDGNVLPRSAWDSGIPVDPGEHSLEFVAPGYSPAQLKFQASETTTRVAAPALSPEAVAAPVAGSDGSAQRTWGWIGVGVGAAGVGAGVVTLILGKGAEGRLAEDCIDGRCPASSQGDIDDANTFQTVSLISFVVGGVALAGGVTLLALAPSASASPSARPGIQPWLSGRAVGIQGAF